MCPLPISLTGMITHGRQPGMFAHYALTCIWPSDPDFTVTSIAKCLRDLESYSGDMSGHLGVALHKDTHQLFHRVLDLEPFKAQNLRRNPIHEYRGPDYAEWPLRGATPRGDATNPSLVDQFLNVQGGRPPAATPREESRLTSDLDGFRGSSGSGPRSTTPRCDSRRGFYMHTLVGSDRGISTGTTPRGDLGSSSDGTSASENVSVSRRSSTPREDTPAVSDFKPLPRHLTLQLDNSGKDNKNQTMIAFGSDLVARGIFETVTFFFLMVGHTHEDIDATFSKVASQTRQKSIDTLPQLMAECWKCMVETHMVPWLITEVCAYKDYLEKHEVLKIRGQRLPMAFRFSMRDNIPIYQYKQNINDAWLPPQGRCIWKQDPITKQLKVPNDSPCAKRMAHKYKKRNEVIPFIRKYVEHLQALCADPTSIGYQRRFPAIAYWRGVAELLEGEFGPDDTAQDFQEIQLPLSSEFWPRTNHGTGFNRALDQNVPSPLQPHGATEILEAEWAEEIEERNTIFVGSLNEKEKEAWSPLEGIKSGWFVCLNPDPKWEKINGQGWFWVVKAVFETEPYVLEEEEQPCFKGEWWRPKHVSPNAPDDTRYLKIFSTTQAWERDPRFPELAWHKASSSMYSWDSKQTKIDTTGLKIGKKVLNIVKAYIQKLQQEEAIAAQAVQED